MKRILPLLAAALFLGACTRAPGPTAPPAIASPTVTSGPAVSRERAIEVASWPIPPEVLSRARISAELHRDLWVVTFENINATLPELRYPDGGLDPQTRYRNVVVEVDANTGHVIGKSAYTPEGVADID